MMRIPADLRDELRRVIALRIYATVHSMPSMSKAEQEDLMASMYHGTNGKASQMRLLVDGVKPYNMLYDEVEDIVEDPNATGVLGTSTKILKPEFSPAKDADRLYIAGSHITTKLLERMTLDDNSVLCTGAYLYRQAIRAMASIRKAIAEAKKLVDEEGKPLMSGHSTEDVLKAVVDKVYEQIGKSGNSSATSSPNDDDDDDESKKKKWFHGYIAFVLFGPLAPKENRLDIFCTGDPEGEGINGRAAQRPGKQKRDV